MTPILVLEAMVPNIVCKVYVNRVWIEESCTSSLHNMLVQSSGLGRFSPLLSSQHQSFLVLMTCLTYS